MKKLLVLLAMVALAAPYAWAGETSGCGLGSTLFEGQSGLVPNVLAITTNGTSWNNTFGITLGTSRCSSSGGTVQNDQQREEFVAVNFEQLAEDMARGEGQYMATMADMMGCPAAVQADFARMSQEQYPVLFPEQEVDAKTWLRGLKTEIGKHPTLAHQCAPIS